MTKNSTHRVSKAKPFLKWAGGKTQLLPELDKRLPSPIKESRTIKRYFEPFVGGGAMFFFLKKNYRIEESFLFDVNPELILTYQVIKKDSKALIHELSQIEEYHLQKSGSDRKENYYRIRDLYNQQMHGFGYSKYGIDWIKRAAYLIFLNKTCFNGLFRQNKVGEFNVPFGRYKNPRICDAENIFQVHKSLQDTFLFCGDFSCTASYIDKKSFIYLDPPYRPLNNTSYFTSYSKEGFKDEDQKKLANFFKKMDKRGAALMLSNSDPKNHDSRDEFFDNLYKDFNIDRVPAKRNINRDATSRGKIMELIIRNYSCE